MGGRGAHEGPAPTQELLVLGDVGGQKSQFPSGIQALSSFSRWSYIHAIQAY